MLYEHTQQLFRNAGKIRYAWKQLPGTEAMSLKNSDHFRDGNTDYIAATDMIEGGTVILRRDGATGNWLVHMRCFQKWAMMWAPHVAKIDGVWTVYCCDTDGGDTSHWWDFMRVYRHTIDLVKKTCGPLTRVEIANDSCGVIDPNVIQIGRWWYMMAAKLLPTATDRKYWDPFAAVSKSPYGPFTNVQYFGAMDFEPIKIDEAADFVWQNDRLLCTFSHGDSGVDGVARVGELKIVGQDPAGWLKFQFDPDLKNSIVAADDGALCTALNLCDDGTVLATLRKVDPKRPASDMLNGFGIYYLT